MITVTRSTRALSSANGINVPTRWHSCFPGRARARAVETVAPGAKRWRGERFCKACAGQLTAVQRSASITAHGAQRNPIATRARRDTEMELSETLPPRYEERMLSAKLDCDNNKGAPDACHAVGEFLAVVKRDYVGARAAYRPRRPRLVRSRSRRRRGYDVDIPWRRVAATPRLRRGYSVGMGRGDAAATTWTVRGDGVGAGTLEIATATTARRASRWDAYYWAVAAAPRTNREASGRLEEAARSATRRRAIIWECWRSRERTR